jgi:hypothetical protein
MINFNASVVIIHNKMKVIRFLFLFFTINNLLNLELRADCNGAWDIWIIPQKNVISIGDSLMVRFGITGFGDLNIYNSKFTIYSENETLISSEDDFNGKYEIYMLPPKSYNDTIDLSKIYKIPFEKNTILIESDCITDFSEVYAYPKTSGDKRLEFIFTYDCDGEWKITSKEFNYHVNTWSEDNEKFLNLIYLIIAVLTILAFTPNNYISSFIKVLFKHRKSKVT